MMLQLEHFCYTCEIELYADVYHNEETGEYYCIKCGAWYKLNEDNTLELLGYAGEI